MHAAVVQSAGRVVVVRQGTMGACRQYCSPCFQPVWLPLPACYLHCQPLRFPLWIEGGGGILLGQNLLQSQFAWASHQERKRRPAAAVTVPCSMHPWSGIA